MRWKLVTWLTVKATDLSNILLKPRDWDTNISTYKAMPTNSLGLLYFNYLKQHNISFKPNLIRHDMKHILLGYEMEMPDELKIHAFLIGNKSYNLMGIFYLMICLLFVPEIIPRLYQEYKRGQYAVCLKDIDLQQFIDHDISIVRRKFRII